MSICDNIKNFFFPPDPTPDEELVAEIKAAVLTLQKLGEKAFKRGITVYLQENWRSSGVRTYCIDPDRLTFHKAYKNNTIRFD